MTDLPGEHPPPHAGLDAQHPLIFIVPAGGVLYRHHRKVQDPVFFGKTGAYRFDDPGLSEARVFRRAVRQRGPRVLPLGILRANDRRACRFGGVS